MNQTNKDSGDKPVAEPKTKTEKILRVTFVILVISWILLLGAAAAKLIIITVNL